MTEQSVSSPRRAWRFPLTVRFEPRLVEPPRWFPLLVSFGAIFFALVLGGGVIALAGGDPVRSYAHIARASFGSLGVFSDTLVKATPLILVGLACALAFRMRLWNIGAEGQFFLGAFGASAVVLIPLLPENTSPWIFIPVMILAGILAGAIWGFIPGFLKARYNVNEIITTLMMNYIAVAWNNFFIYAVWTEGGFQMSHMFPRNAWLPRLADYAKEVPVFRGLTVHLGLVLGIIAAFVVWFILYRSRWGYEIRLIGDNPTAARYAGLNITRNTILVMMVSGALAGLAGMSEITGVVHRLQ
ncbi:MAG: ABC transporter permease, partial [Anaerolineales bacterium]|nr:ABC transporter permease [Anaerolineales bacterium]